MQHVLKDKRMFERIAIKYLRQWAKKEDRKPLVLRGARQVGKTTLVKLFGLSCGSPWIAHQTC